jgi:hypothetical protein
VTARQGLARVEVIATQTGKYRTVVMKSLGDGRYEAMLPALDQADKRAYTIKAIDTQGRETFYPKDGLDQPIVVTLSTDEQSPRVYLERLAKGKPGQALTVHAQVTDPSGIQWVRLRYRHLTQFEDYESLDMKLNPATGLYQGTIPGEFITSEWDLMYFVEAVDTQGNGCTIPDLEIEMPYAIVELKR